MISFKPSKRGGFTLVEILLVMVLVIILGTVTISQIGSNSDSQRWESSRAKIEALRAAIVGDESVDKEGHRTHFGYHGDMGRLPANLGELTTQGAQAAWTFNTFYGVGSGWRGPYVTTEITGPSLDKDAWGRTFVYRTFPAPASLTALGSDGIAGGSVMAKDFAVQFIDGERLATVSGILADGDTRYSTKTVELRRPVNGTLTATTAISSASGYFTFPAVPFGVRAISVLGPNLTYGPNRFAVERAEQTVPHSTINGGGRMQTVSVVGTPTTPCASDTCIQAVLSNTHQTDLVFEYLTINWDRLAAGADGYAQRAVINGSTQLFPPVPPGTKVNFSSSIVFTANTSRTFELHFVGAVNGTGTADMDNTKFYIDFEWVGGKRNNVFFQLP